ncbi:conjugal transfer protein TraF [Vibrio sp. RC27]
MNQYTKIAVLVAGFIASSSVYSATWVADARGNAMGNTGVTSADFVVAPFYNPALTAVYRDDQNIGVLLGLNVNANDPDESLSNIDDIQTLIDDFNEAVDNSNFASIDANTVSELNTQLDDLVDNSAIGVTAGAGLAVALPVKSVSVNLFARAYMELVADVNESNYATGANDAETLDNRINASSVDLVAFGYSEVGLALAKMAMINGERFSFGVSPKIQSLRTYKQTVTVEEFDVEDFDESEVSKSAFNLDLGAVWLKGDYRVGLAVKDMFKQEIKTYDNQDSYTLDPQLVVSGAYVSDFFTAAVDLDLTEQERFATSEDNTQFARFGIEGNAWGWAQLRAGYEIDMVGSMENSVTAGIGFSPFNVVSFDLGASYAGENQFGASTNLEVKF